MEPVSVYRVGVEGADPSYVFGEPPGDLSHVAWVGWLPLFWAQVGGSTYAVAGDSWITEPAYEQGPPRPVLAGSAVNAVEAAAELAARRERGLDAFTDVGSDPSVVGSPLWSLSVAVAVVADIERQLERLRSVHDAVAAEVVAEQARMATDPAGPAASGDSPFRRHRGQTVREWQEVQLQLHHLLEAVVRIGVFDPATWWYESPPDPAGPRSDEDSGD